MHAINLTLGRFKLNKKVTMQTYTTAYMFIEYSNI